jgi:hypothetical protein
MRSGAELLLTALSSLWQVYPHNEGAERPAPSAQNLGVGLLATALAHLHCAISGKDSIDSIKQLFPIALPF